MAFTLVVSRWKSKLCEGNSNVIKIYIIRPKPGSVAKNAKFQGLPAGNWTRVLWITRPVLYHWATEAVANNLGASSVYIYINEMVMPVKYKGILIIILGLIMYILTTLEFPSYNFDFHLVYIRLLRPVLNVELIMCRT